MSAAKVDSAGKVTMLDGRAEAGEVLTEQGAQEPPKLARFLGALAKTVAELRRLWVPRRIDFEDVVVSTAGATVALEHGFKGRVRWWACGWDSAASTAPYLRESATLTTDTTLVLLSYVAGTVCIRVEEAG